MLLKPGTHYLKHAQEQGESGLAEIRNGSVVSYLLCYATQMTGPYSCLCATPVSSIIFISRLA